jgi:hypothetical protein
MVALGFLSIAASSVTCAHTDRLSGSQHTFNCNVSAAITTPHLTHAQHVPAPDPLLNLLPVHGLHLRHSGPNACGATSWNTVCSCWL